MEANPSSYSTGTLWITRLCPCGWWERELFSVPLPVPVLGELWGCLCFFPMALCLASQVVVSHPHSSVLSWGIFTPLEFIPCVASSLPCAALCLLTLGISELPASSLPVLLGSLWVSTCCSMETLQVASLVQLRGVLPHVFCMSGMTSLFFAWYPMF